MRGCCDIKEKVPFFFRQASVAVRIIISGGERRDGSANLSSPAVTRQLKRRSGTQRLPDSSLFLLLHLHQTMSPTNQPTQEQLDEWKEAFSLYDKKGNSTVSSANLGDLLRGLGQNPTQAEVRELVKSVGGSERQEVDIDFGTFLTILTRPDGFKPAGTSQEFIQGFQVFDKEGDGTISAGELRYVLTNLGEKLSEEEVDELLKEVEVGKDGRINYVDFVNLILSN